MVKLSGGGLNSNKTVHGKSSKTEPVAHKANPAGVNQMGVATQFRKEPVIGGKGYEPGAMPATGSRGTFNPASQGPGSGRTTYRSGSQSATPPAQEMPAGREILGSFGPEITGPGRRR